ncbi:prostaglandin reductase 1 [Folsomia candida]|uniref:prostaglandin reductase 1 n=1 Tax=Folsomia candida TaxID=158441 RepID=UPI000B8FFA62|nr:prostaglandin reductase 1 [Folsomia candida]
MTIKARKFVLRNRPQGLPKTSDFELVEEEISENLEDGEILCKAEWLSVDPYMRLVANNLQLGEMMPGVQVARVIKSRSPEYEEGSKVVGLFGWRDTTKCNPSLHTEIEYLYPLPDMKSLPESYAIGSVGRVGNTAYFGLLDVGCPQPGETVVVSAAAGAVGSLVGQIAKLKGCKVVGFAGSDEKVDFLLNDLGFENAFNYKTVNVPDALVKAAPKGVDVYFDNVGGEFAFHVTQKMNQGGRIALCGAISSYNRDASQPAMIPFDYTKMIYNNIKLEGLHVLRWKHRWFEGINQIRDWILEGKIVVRETVTEGFENMPEAFIRLLKGSNIGKEVVKC